MYPWSFSISLRCFTISSSYWSHWVSLSLHWKLVFWSLTWHPLHSFWLWQSLRKNLMTFKGSIKTETLTTKNMKNWGKIKHLRKCRHPKSKLETSSKFIKMREFQQIWFYYRRLRSQALSLSELINLMERPIGNWGKLYLLHRKCSQVLDLFRLREKLSLILQITLFMISRDTLKAMISLL